jgi:hypothetical protein
MIGVTLFIVAVVVIAIWVFIEIKRLKHKIFAVFLICLILFGYFSFLFVFKGKDINYKSIPGVIDATKIYFNWLFSIVGNFKSITTNAVKMDWQGNKTIG